MVTVISQESLLYRHTQVAKAVSRKRVYDILYFIFITSNKLGLKTDSFENHVYVHPLNSSQRGCSLSLVLTA